MALHSITFARGRGSDQAVAFVRVSARICGLIAAPPRGDTASASMFRPLSLFIGLRYVRARQHKFFVSFITWVSLLGVALGVAALIVVLSVMNGFEGELRDRLLTLSAHARVWRAAPPANRSVPVTDWDALATALRHIQGVRGVVPYVEVQALAVREPEMLALQLRGIEPAQEAQVASVAAAVTDGSIAALLPGRDRLLLGSVVAQQLDVARGDTLTLLIPGIEDDGSLRPRLREFVVAGIFEVGLQELDGALALANYADVAALAPDDRTARGLRLRFDDALRAPVYAAAVAARLPPGLVVRDWTVEHASYFRAIRIEKTMMAIILLLIVAVAAFSIVAMLVMVVTDKRNDIAILRTLGASPGRVSRIFLTQGLVIGWSGVLLGVLLGIVLSHNAGTIVAHLEHWFGFHVMDPNVYYITEIPSELRLPNVLWIGGIALLMTALATVYPALRAARVPPAEALRYE